MNLLFSALVLLLASAGLALVVRGNRLAGWVAAAGALSGGGALLLAGAGVLTDAAVVTWSAPWRMSFGALALRLDPLAAVFLMPLAVVGSLCAVYGVTYMQRHAHGRPIGGTLAAYNLLLFSMVLVVVADHLLLLLIAWELMTLASWALVVSDGADARVRAAGLYYLIAAHVATACLFGLFLALEEGSGSFGIAAQAGGLPSRATLLFLLALIGFGTKAGIAPFHVWLPDAHPAAPSHVSALMSGVMITMGFYGLARFIPLLGPPSPWWPYLLMALGVLGAVGGIAFALAQRDVKRALAYSTIENAGIITLAMGLGLLGATLEEPSLALLGWTATLFHLWNHALAKALLFLGCGAIAQSAGDRSLEAWGGFVARWPLAGGLLLVGCAAIAALPGLNVFASEWLLLRGLLSGTLVVGDVARVVLIAALALLAFSSGLAVACFARIAGVGLLGSARSAGAREALPPALAMWLPLLLLASGCFLIGLLPHRVAGALSAAVAQLVPGGNPAQVTDVLGPLAILAPLLLAIAIGIAGLRALAAWRTRPARAVTWGCGYPAVTSAMQYTAASFSEPLTRVMQPLLRTEVDRAMAHTGSASRPLAWSSTTPDVLLAGFYRPLFERTAHLFARLRAYHQPRVSRSLLYIVLTVLVLLSLLFLPAVYP
jgi:formate hydrogenlyase subunit 3/multisubunit Na+/H+ antiporter MnhD subunit